MIVCDSLEMKPVIRASAATAVFATLLVFSAGVALVYSGLGMAPRNAAFLLFSATQLLLPGLAWEFPPYALATVQLSAISSIFLWSLLKRQSILFQTCVTAYALFSMSVYFFSAIGLILRVAPQGLIVWWVLCLIVAAAIQAVWKVWRGQQKITMPCRWAFLLYGLILAVAAIPLRLIIAP